MTQKIIVSQKYRDMVPPLEAKEREALKTDIQKNGLHYPGITNKDGVLLDGHHRYDACKELGLKFPCTTKYFKDKLDEEEFVVSVNLLRRHLTPYQRTLMGMVIEEIETRRIKQQESSRKKGLVSIETTPKDPERAAKIAAEKVNMKFTTYYRSRTIVKEGSQELQKQFQQSKVSPDKGYNIIQHEKRREKARKEAFDADWKRTMGSEKYGLYQGDILEMGKKIADNSVDLIFTDPPYLGETLDVYKKLGDLAVRVLKPGGSLVTIVGHHYIFKIHEMISDARNWKDGVSDFLQYHWMIILRHGGHARRVHAYGVWAHYKPILWYYKPKKGSQKPTMYHDMADLVESKPVDKSLHEWEQSTIEAKNVIHSLTVERELVLDPFLGSGSTGVAAIKMNRRFRGIEIDPETMKIAAKRLSEL